MEGRERGRGALSENPAEKVYVVNIIVFKIFPRWIMTVFANRRDGGISVFIR